MDGLQLILLSGIAALALINALSLIWASYLERKLRQRPAAKVYEVHLDATKVLSEMNMAELQKQAEAQLNASIEEAVQHVKNSVSKSAEQVAGHINETTMTNLSQEFEKYQVSLNALREQTIQEFTKLQQEIDQRRDTLIIDLNKSVNKENQKRLEQFTNRLNEVVASYLSESLGNQVDLGAQLPYILGKLQEQKDDIKRDILS